MQSEKDANADPKAVAAGARLVVLYIRSRLHLGVIFPSCRWISHFRKRVSTWSRLRKAGQGGDAPRATCLKPFSISSCMEGFGMRSNGIWEIGWVDVLGGMSCSAGGILVKQGKVNCSCNADADVDGIGCMIWVGDLIDVQNFDNGGSTLHIRLAHSEFGKFSSLYNFVIVSLHFYFPWKSL
ncbi:hypothetical protein Pint_32894 [Pistacia integerrima]|uniref:Uncharacterized protein n=1 Tax=Pistacia integerrima TaxID=434235 RepID=A0ACC0X6A4_9ROSI|nr:hypothetical protein Pint_32894 [Pistacia integerrima]